MRDLGADIIAISPDGFVAAIDVKNSENLDRQAAIALRKSMASHGILPHARYFLLLSQDQGHLWDGASMKDLDAAPRWSFSMQPIIARYWPGGTLSGRLRGSELELLVFQWLSDLRNRDDHPKGEAEQALEESGLLPSLRERDLSLSVQVA